jgi:enoyl-CoA hydratase/carnithine racemase
MIDVRDAGPVRVLTLASGKVNALDVELLTDLCAALQAARQRGQRALVLTGAGAVFSAGVDLRRVIDGGSAYTDRLIPALSGAFLELFGYPGPTVAAINGAAIAGGCVLACACDRRLIRPDAPIGASELRVGVPFPAAALEILRHACGDHAEDVILDGQLHRGGEARARRLAHTVVDGDVLGAAVDLASELTAIPADVYESTKARLRAPAQARAGAADDDEVRAVWGSTRTRDAIAAHMDRLVQRRPL